MKRKARRFGQKHGYRFDKQALLWETPRLRTPEQFEAGVKKKTNLLQADSSTKVFKEYL